MDNNYLESIEEKYKSEFNLIKSASLLGLLLDQHDSNSGEFSGSWGKTVSDYCFLNTRDYPWSLNKGSITHTMWALQALRYLLQNSDNETINSAILESLGYASNYVACALSKKFDSDDSISKLRHCITCSLAVNFITKGKNSLNEDDLISELRNLHKYINSNIKILLDKEKFKGGDSAQILSYFLWLNEFEDLVVDEKSFIDNITKQIKDLIESKVIGKWKDKKVLNPLLQISIIQFIIGKINKNYKLKDPLLEEINKYSKRFITILSNKNDTFPIINNKGLFDEWTLLVFVITFLNNNTYIEEHYLRICESIVQRCLQEIIDKKSNYLSNTIIWSLLLQSLKYENLVEAIKNFEIIDDIRSNNQGLCKQLSTSCIGILPNESQKFILKVFNNKFYFNYPESNKDLKEFILNRMSYFESISFDISENGLPIKLKPHIQNIYGDIKAFLNPKIARVHLILCGFSTSGKSTVCNLLESFDDVIILKRPTTRIDSSIVEEEKERYDCLSLSNFVKYQKEEEILFEHELWDNKYGFYKSEINSGTSNKLLVYQVGWSIYAIEDIIAYLNTNFRTEPKLNIVLKPNEEALVKRLSEGRHRTENNIIFDLKEANEFYSKVNHLNIETHIIDTSLRRQKSSISLLNIVFKYFDFKIETNAKKNRVFDLFISYRSKDKEIIVEQFVKKMESFNVSCFYDENNIKPFESIFEKLNKGILQSEYIIAFISEDYFQSNYPPNELESFMNVQKDNKVRILPVLLGIDFSEIKEKITLINHIKPYEIKKYSRDSKVDDLQIDKLVGHVRDVLKSTE